MAINIIYERLIPNSALLVMTCICSLPDISTCTSQAFKLDIFKDLIFFFLPINLPFPLSFSSPFVTLPSSNILKTKSRGHWLIPSLSLFWIQPLVHHTAIFIQAREDTVRWSPIWCPISPLVLLIQSQENSQKNLANLLEHVLTTIHLFLTVCQIKFHFFKA